jgi:hypothetical protein
VRSAGSLIPVDESALRLAFEGPEKDFCDHRVKALRRVDHVPDQVPPIVISLLELTAIVPILQQNTTEEARVVVIRASNCDPHEAAGSCRGYIQRLCRLSLFVTVARVHLTDAPTQRFGSLSDCEDEAGCEVSTSRRRAVRAARASSINATCRSRVIGNIHRRCCG